MIATPLIGPKNGVNQVFTLTPGLGLVLIVWAQRILKPVTGAPGSFEYVRSNTVTVTLGSAPGPSDMLFAYIQLDASYGLTEVPVNGVQNGVNLTFTLPSAPPAGMLLFKNGFLLEQTATIPTTIQYQLLGGTTLSLGLAPVSTDKLRAFISAPATAALSTLAFTGTQDSANTRYLLGYNTPQGTEPVLFPIFDGKLLQRTLERPGSEEYALLATNEVLLGFAPAPTTALQFILIGTLVLTVSPYSFTQDKLARRVGIFTSRKLDQLEAREVVSQVYSEFIATYQWSFLHAAGSFATEGLKTNGTITVTEGSQVIVGAGTTFAAGDVGKTVRVSGANYGYTILSVEPVTQRIQITPVYVDVTATAQKYQLYQAVYALPLGVEYVFSMTSQYPLREIPYSLLQTIDPMRTSTADVPQNFAYAGRDSTGASLIELYPIPSSPAVIRFSGIRNDALTDPQQKLKGIETLIFNAAAAMACRIIATKEGEGKNANTWITLSGTYDQKAAAILERLDSLDLTRSDVAKVQGMRGDGGTYDGWYEATHDTWSEDLW